MGTRSFVRVQGTEDGRVSERRRRGDGDWVHGELTRAIIGVYYDVFNGTGRSYPEFIYETAMARELRRRGVACRRQAEYEIWYKEKLVGLQRLDLFVAQDVVVEIKVVRELTPLHKAQAISYLKTVGKDVSLLCNYGATRPEFVRLYRPPPRCQEERLDPVSGVPADELITSVIGGLYEVHTTLGPGLVHRIYANAVYHELQLRGLDVAPRREILVIYRGQSVGEIKFNHLEVEGSLMVFPMTVQAMSDVCVPNLRAWMGVRDMAAGVVANFRGTSLDFLVMRV